MSSPRPYLAREDRRDALLDAAADVLRESGPEALSLRAVADRAGVAHRLVSYAFGSKVELVKALLLRETGAAIDVTWRSPMTGDGIEDAVATALSAFADSLREDPRYAECLVALTTTARLSPQLVDATREETEFTRARIRAHVAEWAAAHSDAEVDVDRVADGIHASAEGITAWWLATRDDEGLAAVVRGFAAGVARTR